MALKTAPENPLIPSPRPTNFFETAFGFSQVQQALYVAFRDLAYRANRVLPKDGTEPMEGPLVLGFFPTASLPAAADFEGAWVYDTTVNEVKWSNGAVWNTIPADLAAQVLAIANRVTFLETPPIIATSSVYDSTTAATMQNSSLNATITPQFSNSIIEATAIIPNAVAFLVSGSVAARVMFLEIRNMTDGVSSPSYFVGRNLATASSAQAAAGGSVTMIWHYTVDSTAARTFRVRFQAAIDTVLQADIRGDISPTTMILREIKQ